ncbi:MAG: ribonuclease P protein component [Bacilli bacterium]|nr:ribonuclease P protein component [Bacilli bacterium]
MKKINIIKKTQEFEKIIKEGHYYSNRFFVIYVTTKQKKYYRFGISVPKKVGNSVIRNKTKRQIKNILDQNISFNKEIDYVIIIKKEINDISYGEKVRQLQLLLTKIDGAWKDEKI